ncbi:MAG: lipopolysaccharide biosynthesis protein RfbH [Gammaproteobacteria bacterium]|jgi:CDP-4-dehydro-6-deoxyglucose reductase, E1|nr:lipopolysaccharide biosynthesis protein RfbH [Gammaproteobacteria bacterium]
MNDDATRQRILDLVAGYSELKYSQAAGFVPGETPIPPSGKVLGASEIVAAVDASLDGWLTTGRFNDEFETNLSAFLGPRHVLTTNSGSSANLVAFSTLTSPKLEDRALKPGDEVITVAAGFPTTVNPILLYGMVPVFVDIDLATCNIDANQIESALTDKTRAIMLAHTLGNPFNLGIVGEIARNHNLWLIEDCCDALGSTYEGKQVGNFGDIGTLSFYPAHHITMGEGGAVFTQKSKLARIMESIRDWGRDCYCEPGAENTCKQRYDWQLGELPAGYDHKYIYSHLGFNLKITDMQAAVANAQLQRLPGFIASRKENFSILKEGLSDLDNHMVLPEATPGSDPSWFGFPISLREDLRPELLHFLDDRKIGTRLLFGGNLTKQPYFDGREYRVHGKLTNTDIAMERALWMGVYPGLQPEMLEYMIQSLHDFFGNK